MRLRIFGTDVVQVVGGQKRNVEFASNLEHILVGAALDLDAVVHDFAKIVFFAEDVLIGSRGLERGLITGGAKQCLNFAGCASGGSDDALGVLRQYLAIHSRLVIDAV